MLVGFYDPDADRFLKVENALFGWNMVPLAAMELQTKQNLPSRIWCSWDEERISVFGLGSDIPSLELCERILLHIQTSNLYDV